MKMRLLKFFTVVGMLLLVFGCGDDSAGGSSDGGTVTPPTPTPTAAKLDITTNNYQLNTNGLDTATLTIVARNANNAAVSGVVVNVSASAGLLSASQVTTGAAGTATVTFSPGPEKANQVVTITASSGSLSKDLPLTILGTTLSLTSTKSSLLANASPSDSTALTVKALDASSKPIPNAVVTLSSAKGNSLSAGTVTTNSSGTATVTLAATATPGLDTISASGLGAQTTLDINVTSAQFGLTSATDTPLAVGASTVLTLTWTNAAGNPVAGQIVTFTTTGGYFDGVSSRAATTATTNSLGKATVNFTAGSTATPADITAASGGESDTLRLLIASTNPSRLNLQASPSVLGPSVGGVTSSSRITATVRDANNQLVSGETVVFTLISGPGGGESLSPGTAETDAGGSAFVTFTSGSAVSAQNGVKIRATIYPDNSSPISAETTLTIGQQATSIVLGTTNKIAKVSVGGLDVAYALPFSVLVVDSNGNPIPNATVNLGIYPLYFYTGLALDDTPNWDGKFMNEDRNRNGILDPGEDGARGWDNPLVITGTNPDEVWLDGAVSNDPDTVPLIPPGYAFNPDDPNPYGTFVGTANGRLDPGGVATIPASVTTDNAGLAAFEVKYAKAYGNWVQVEITATTRVAGDLSTAKIAPTLGVLANDLPYLDSPFGW